MFLSISGVRAQILDPTLTKGPCSWGSLLHLSLLGCHYTFGKELIAMTPQMASGHSKKQDSLFIVVTSLWNACLCSSSNAYFSLPRLSARPSLPTFLYASTSNHFPAHLCLSLSGYLGYILSGYIHGLFSHRHFPSWYYSQRVENFFLPRLCIYIYNFICRPYNTGLQSC